MINLLNQTSFLLRLVVFMETDITIPTVPSSLCKVAIVDGMAEVQAFEIGVAKTVCN